MRFLIIFIFLVSNSFAKEVNGIKNLVLIEKPKKYESLTFLDDQNNQVDISQYKGKLILLNFWATWCAPCKEEMPSLNSLQTKDQLNNLKIFPINVGQDDPKKASSFFDDLNINNLRPYFDSPVTLAKKFQLRVTNLLTKIFFPIHWVFREYSIIQYLLRRISPISFYYGMFDLNKDQHYELSKLDTHDKNTDHFKRMVTEKQLNKMIDKFCFKKFKIFRGGTGLQCIIEK
mgnify:CR=1 FL=1